jgi:hypothetical protein
MFAVIDGIAHDDLLVGWRWLVPQSSRVLKATAIGDLFLQDADGGIHFLDAKFGKLKFVARTAEELDRLFDQRDFRQNFLYSFMVRTLVQKGMKLPRGKCYSLRIPVHLGGSFGSENVEIVDLLVHLSVLGQLHEQTRPA